MGLATAATTITATNNSNAATMQIVDNAGNALAGGIVQVGFFADPGNIAVGDFTSFGSAAFSTSGLAPGVFGSFGGTGITGDLSNASQADDAFIGNSIFVVIIDPSAPGRIELWTNLRE
ncbi:MAG: hypothetical protein OSB65_19665 [Roseibacillus sp.]|nr:hypothetical protein [Roseibacillus sp.]